MNLIVNGDSHSHNGQGTLAELLQDYQAEPLRTAIMVNGEVITRKKWENVRLSEGDQVELLTFSAGG
jgi:thiamine biosynthesis protein ThiS